MMDQRLRWAGREAAESPGARDEQAAQPVSPVQEHLPGVKPRVCSGNGDSDSESGSSSSDSGSDSEDDDDHKVSQTPSRSRSQV